MTFAPPPLHSAPNIKYLFLLIFFSFVFVGIVIILLMTACKCIINSLLRCLRSCWVKKQPEIIPVCRYKEEQTFSTECSVCLMEFRKGEKVRQLPACRHSFHAPCVDMWLYSHSSCPSCRAPVPHAAIC